MKATFIPNSQNFIEISNETEHRDTIKKITTKGIPIGECVQPLDWKVYGLPLDHLLIQSEQGFRLVGKPL